MVGDPKQSIYRFRRADIQLYGLVKNRFGEFGETVELTTNFRSRPPIGELVNELFATEGFFPSESTPEQAAFEPLNTRPPAGPVPAELYFRNTGNYAVGGTISGTGTVWFSGVDGTTMTLSGDNTSAANFTGTALLLLHLYEDTGDPTYLDRAAQVRLSGELLRQIVESEGRAVQAQAQAGTLPVDWQAGDCVAAGPDGQPTDRSRVYLGCDGVLVPVVTQKEKDTRRAV